MKDEKHALHRRDFMATGLATVAASCLPAGAMARAAAKPVAEQALTAESARVALVGGKQPATVVWAYNQTVPGPVIRAPQGGRLRVHVRNRLPEPTTVHFHGVRMPNAMDGVPFVTQDPIAPGKTFRYDFVLPDAGTFWYHPHINSGEQVGRGLAGVLVVEERDPIKVDRDLVWALDDWRLDRSAAIAGDFRQPRDLSHNGRLGNTVTVNGRIQEQFRVRSGERIRLRLVNVANARVFALRFAGHAPQVIALDGQPVEPHAAPDGVVLVAPAQRVDLVLDMTGEPGARFAVVDAYYRQPYRLLNLVYDKGKPFREGPLDAPIALPPNPLPEPDLAAATRHEILLEGGAMGGMTGARMAGQGAVSGIMSMRDLMQRGLFWAINGVAVPEAARAIEPLVTMNRGTSHILSMVNETSWDHPMHLHGHSFRVITRNGKPAPRREWLDTVLVRPRERVEVAFVADNPGDWMFHCHILEHLMAGMMATVRVT
jgi:FtsP/CotA-like multicopper oxidase with cupredoxin domain